MRNHVSINGHGSPTVLDQLPHDWGDGAMELEALVPGECVAARDGAHFIRTTLICFGFCDLATGELCSARDICARHGGACTSSAAASSARRSRSRTTRGERLQADQDDEFVIG